MTKRLFDRKISGADIRFLEGGAALLDEIAPLWKKLTLHHSGISTYFSREFEYIKWQERRADLLEKARLGKLYIVLAKIAPRGLYVGYCVGAINPKGHAEIESLFVEDEFRGKGIGSRLVELVIVWFDREKAKSVMVNVAVGNEDAFEFYRQWRFYPRVTALVRKKSPQRRREEESKN